MPERSPRTVAPRLAALAFALLAWAGAGEVLAQADPRPREDVAVDSALIERTLVEAKWRYVYTVHAGSSTIIHEAGDDYQFYLYFRYDYTAEEFLNGHYERKAWALAGDLIYYPFRNVKLFRVVQAGRDRLALEFTQPNSKGAYQYHFARVDDADAPFIKPVNQLPTVTVEGVTKQRRRRRILPRGDDAVAGVKEERRWWPLARRDKEERLAARQERRRERAAAKAAKREVKRRTRDGVLAEDAMIEMTGGGFFGGIDPVMRDHTVIKPGGRLVKEFKTVQTDLRRTTLDLDVTEYNRLVAFIRDQGFFDLERSYDCTSEVCVRRKRQKPTPVPLRIAVSDGKRKKVVNVSIYGTDERGGRYVDYPPALEEVIQAVLKVSNGAEEVLVRG